jgi:hypothetical protein
MQKTLLLIVIAAVIPLSLGADVDVLDYSIEVSADANPVISGGPYSDAYWIETDETVGIVVLRFRDDRLSELQPCEEPFLETFRLSLKLTIPDVTDAGSDDGVIVLYNGAEIGRIDRVSRGSDVEIQLDSFAVTPAEEILLVLQGAGPDGAAVSSKASGSGARLRVVVFPDNSGYDDSLIMEELELGQ